MPIPNLHFNLANIWGHIIIILYLFKQHISCAWPPAITGPCKQPLFELSTLAVLPFVACQMKAIQTEEVKVQQSGWDEPGSKCNK